MAKGFFVEGVEPAAWTLRLRDAESGEAVTVKLMPDGRLSLPSKPRDDDSRRGEREPRERRTDEKKDPKADRRSADVVDKDRDEKKDKQSRKSDPGTADAADKPTRKKLSPRLPRMTEPQAVEAVMSAPALRSMPVDEATVSEEDRVAFDTRQQRMRRMDRAGKVGALGWAETTDAGRAALVARSGGGSYKILHAGGDIFALFYEWDDGRFDRIACGRREELMQTANHRAQEDPPRPPMTHLTLELARYMCGTPEQQASAAERLAPAVHEVREDPSRPGMPVPPVTPPSRAPLPTQDDALDRKLAESLKQVLGELDVEAATATEEA